MEILTTVIKLVTHVQPYDKRKNALCFIFASSCWKK